MGKRVSNANKVLNEQADEAGKKVVTFLSKHRKKYSEALKLTNKPSTVRDRKKTIKKLVMFRIFIIIEIHLLKSSIFFYVSLRPLKQDLDLMRWCLCTPQIGKDPR